MQEDIVEYTKTCFTCQQDKVDRQKPPRLLELLLVPNRLRESVSFDFITNLRKMGNLTSILVVVDQFLKYATFIPTLKQCPTYKIACLFFKNVVKYWSVP